MSMYFPVIEASMSMSRHTCAFVPVCATIDLWRMWYRMLSVANVDDFASGATIMTFVFMVLP
jgi:hypothetical protein